MKSILLNEVEKSLEFIEWNISMQEFLQKAARYSFCIALFLWLVSSLVIEDILISIAIALIGFISAIAIACYLPIMKGKQKNDLLEKNLPMLLTGMAIELNLGISFNECLKNSARNSRGVLKKEFQKIVLEVESAGKSVQEALMNFAKRSDSITVKRIASQLVNIYEQGGEKEMRGDPLKKLAEELLSKQRIELKKFSGKIAVMSLFFIAVSAIIPAIFQAFIIVGSMVLEIGFTAEQVMLIICVAFPAIDVIFLFYLKGQTPVFLKEEF